MLETDATLLHQELVKRHVQAVIVEEWGLFAIQINQGVTCPTKYCSVIGTGGAISWGQQWQYSVNVAHAELAAPAIARTLPSLCFKPKRRPGHDAAIARREQEQEQSNGESVEVQQGT